MNSKKYLIIGIVSTLILFIGTSVAYFTGIINGEGKKITVTAKKLEVVFTDSEVITASEIIPGWEYTKTFTVENRTGNIFYYDISIKDLENTFETEYLEYQITSSNGYNMTEYREVPKNIGTLGRNISINDKETHTYTIKFRFREESEIDQSADMGKTFSGSLQITETPNMIKQILADNPVVLERTNFNTTLGSETPTNNTIYKASGTYTEDGSEVYYFAGNVSNNWVKFGQDENNNDLYWRIIRTNEDGSIRLLYAGTSPDTTERYITVDGKNQFALNFGGYDDPMYVGYMYGTKGSLANNRTNENSSTAKITIDTWYSRGLNVKTDLTGNTYDKYVSRTAIYCNDRSGDSYSATTFMRFASEFRSKKTGSYRCGYNSAGGRWAPGNAPYTWIEQPLGMYTDASVKDKFTVSTKTGNGELTYPVALITADEIRMAQTAYAQPYFYLGYNKKWMTMSPSYYDTSNGGYVEVIYVVDNYTDSSDGDSYGFIRPVLSLKSCVTYKSGNGTADAPYEVSVDSTCAAQEN